MSSATINLNQTDSDFSDSEHKSVSLNLSKSEIQEKEETDSDLRPTSDEFCPIVQLSEGSEDFVTTVSGIHKVLKKLGYKNPFVYTKLKKKRGRKGAKAKSPVDVPIEKECINSNKHDMEIEYKPDILSDCLSNNKWQCMICSELRKDKDDLLKHYENHRIETDSIKGNELRGDYYMCPVCFSDFTSLASYENHVELEHGENQSICKTCYKSFKNLYLLCIHNFNKHTLDKIYRCTCCDFEHAKAKELQKHIKIEHKEHKCEVCNRNFSSSTWYEEHKNFHVDATKFTCELCAASFQYSRYLVAHKKEKHPQIFAEIAVTHECEICNKKFAHKKSLIAHVRSHTGQSSVLCDFCGKSLSCPDHLKKHLRIHSGDKPHICQICGKGFSDKSNLKLHDRVHTGEKPHICNVCNKGFSQRSSLVIHGRLHSGERPYKCHLCSRGFVAKGLLGVHIKTCNGIGKI